MCVRRPNQDHAHTHLAHQACPLGWRRNLLPAPGGPIARISRPPLTSLAPPTAIDDPHKIVKVIASDGKTGDTREISYSNCKVIGNGSFGVVFQAKLVGGPKDGEDIAIKKVLQDKRFKVRARAAGLAHRVVPRLIAAAAAFFRTESCRSCGSCTTPTSSTSRRSSTRTAKR